MNYEWWLKELKEVLIPCAKGEYKKAAEEEWCWTLNEELNEYERSQHAD